MQENNGLVFYRNDLQLKIHGQVNDNKKKETTNNGPRFLEQIDYTMT